MNTRVQLACAWCGPALMAIFIVGFILLAGFIPPPSPTDSAEEIAALYRDNLTGIRLGITLSIVGWTLIGPWGITIAVHTRREGKGSRTLTYLQIASAGAAISIVAITLLLYGLAAFRPDDLAADTTRMLNDFAWFLFLYSWPPFSLWMVAMGLAIITDDRPQPAFPRWSAYLNFWAALLIVPAGLIIFAKDGPFAFNGAFALYTPLVVFFAWMSTMTYLVIRSIKRDAQEATLSSRAAQASREAVVA